MSTQRTRCEHSLRVIRVSTPSTYCERSLRVAPMLPHFGTQRQNRSYEWLFRIAFRSSSRPDTDTPVGDNNAAHLQPPAHAGSTRHWIPCRVGYCDLGPAAGMHSGETRLMGEQSVAGCWPPSTCVSTLSTLCNSLDCSGRRPNGADHWCEWLIRAAVSNTHAHAHAHAHARTGARHSNVHSHANPHAAYLKIDMPLC